MGTQQVDGKVDSKARSWPGASPVNGKLGVALEWLRWIGQVIIVPLVVAGFLWARGVEHDLTLLNDFRDQGPRFTGSEQYRNADDLRRQMLLDVQALFERHAEAHANLPPVQYRDLQNERYKDLKDHLERLETKMNEILRWELEEQRRHHQP